MYDFRRKKAKRATGKREVDVFSASPQISWLWCLRHEGPHPKMTHRARSTDRRIGKVHWEQRAVNFLSMRYASKSESAKHPTLHVILFFVRRPEKRSNDNTNRTISRIPMFSPETVLMAHTTTPIKKMLPNMYMPWGTRKMGCSTSPF